MADELTILGLIIFGLLIVGPLYFAAMFDDDDDN